MSLEHRKRRPIQSALIAPPADNRIDVDEHCYIRQDQPNTAFGAPSTAYFYSRGATDDAFPVFKFQSRLPLLTSPTDFTWRSIQLYVAELGRLGIEFNNGSTGSNFITIFDFYMIEEDFDTATLTWNSFNALTKTFRVNVHGLMLVPSIAFPTRSYDGRLLHYENILGAEVARRTGLIIQQLYLPLLFSNQAYGFALRPRISAGLGSWFRGTFTRTLFAGSKPSSRYKSFITWTTTT